MTARYIGSLTIGGALPGMSALVTAGLGGISLVLPELQSRLDSLLSWRPSPITIPAQIQQLQSMIAGLQLQLSLGVAPPSMTMQLAELAKLTAELHASISQLTAQQTVLLEAQQLMATAGVHAVAFSGRADRLGLEVGGAIEGAPGISPADATQAITLATTTPAVFAALSQLVKV